MYVARHKITKKEHITSAKDKHAKVLKALDSQGAFVLQLQDLILIQTGTVPNAPAATEFVQVRQRFLPSAVAVDEEKRPNADRFLTARFLGKFFEHRVVCVNSMFTRLAV